MEIISGIDADLCIGCGKCIRVCPAHIIVAEDGAMKLVYAETCIACGHCVDVCPVGAIQHPAFPSEKVHSIDYAQIPLPAQLMLLMKTRRSNRALTDKAVPADALQQIVEAAHVAPTASNRQDVAFTVITDPVRLRIVRDFTMRALGRNLKMLKSPLLKPVLKLLKPELLRYIPVFERIEREYAKGNDPILRGATALLLIHTSKKNRFGNTDANLAYQNGSLMAESLGVSQIYTGFVMTVVRAHTGRLEKQLGIIGTLHAGMALGMPQFRYPNYTDRHAAEIAFDQ